MATEIARKFLMKGNAWRSSLLVTAEIELPSEDAQFPRPVWFGRDMFADHRYMNNKLI